MIAPPTVTEMNERDKLLRSCPGNENCVVVSVPFGRYRELPTEAVAGKVVIDTNNYYPQRDGHFDELESDRTTSSELLQAHLSGARGSRRSTRSSGRACATAAVPPATASASASRSQAMTMKRSKRWRS
jgi:hypothetical protein